jgi:hypothetical protein
MLLDIVTELAYRLSLLTCSDNMMSPEHQLSLPSRLGDMTNPEHHMPLPNRLNNMTNTEHPISPKNYLDDMPSLEHPMLQRNCLSMVWCTTDRHTTVAKRSQGESRTSSVIFLSALTSSDLAARTILTRYSQRKSLPLINGPLRPTRLRPGFWSQERD